MAITAAFQLLQDEIDAMGAVQGVTGLTGFPASFAGAAFKPLRVNAAESAIEFSAKITPLNVTASRDIAASDVGRLLLCNSASPITLTVQPVATVLIDVESPILICQLGAGKVTIAPGSGVTLRSSGSLLSTNGQFSQITLYQYVADNWLVGGDRGA